MAKSMKELNDGLKKKYYDMIEELTQEKDIEVLRVPLTDASNSVAYRLAIPELDEENNEKAVIITITVPTGGRDGEEYDIYGEHYRYRFNVEENEKKLKEREDKKKKKEAERERKRAAKAVPKKEA